MQGQQAHKVRKAMWDLQVQLARRGRLGPRVLKALRELRDQVGLKALPDQPEHKG